MHKSLTGTPLAVLDLVLYGNGTSIAEAFQATVDTVRHAEALGFSRFWVAEHHNMEGVASAATAVLIGHLASQTTAIRVGSGGMMLPNHTPFAVAEQFGTLATLYPNRIDLGLGRAPGGDRLVMQALRASPVDFGEQVEELQFFFQPASEGQALKAVPGAGVPVPLWILGSSLYSARLAGRLGLPYVFASHFAPGLLLPAVALYRQEFIASSVLAAPYVMVGVPVVAAATAARAAFLATTTYQRFLGLVRGQRLRRPEPVADMAAVWSPAEKAAVMSMLAEMVVGGPTEVADGLQRLITRTGADELIVLNDPYDHGDRVQALEILAGVAGLKPSRIRA